MRCEIGRASEADPTSLERLPADCGGGVGSIVGGGDGNTASGTDSGVGAGKNNTAAQAEAAIFAGAGNQVGASATAPNAVIGAGASDSIAGSASDATLGAGYENALRGQNAVLAAGSQNANSASSAFAGAGESNTVTTAGVDGVVTGGSANALSGEYAVLVGGLDNTVSGEGGYIAAGGYNTVSGEGAVIDGGFDSTASGAFATIPGGYADNAAGTYGLAAGARASAAQTGTFVWSDGSNGDTTLSSSAAYQFTARASGGFTLWTNAGSTVGATLSPGSGTWASSSDRGVKSDIHPVDAASVLRRIAALPISRWRYRGQRATQHVGPMAQEFFAAFAVGPDDTHITAIDEDGVALAAVKALRAEIAAVQSANRALRRDVETARALETQRAEHAVRTRASLSALRARIAAYRRSIP